MFFILGVTHNDPSFVQIGPKKQFLRGFTNLFSEVMDCNTSYVWKYFSGNQPKKVKWVWSLGQNWAKLGPMLWKNKETGIINGLFSNFAWGIDLKARSIGYRNTWVEIEGQNSKKYHIKRKSGLNFCPLFWVKNSKKRLFSRFLLY